MSYIDENLPLDIPALDNSMIKVVGVGGGGGNAVNHMYRQGITGVSFVVCNTDNQALLKSPIPTKVQLGIETTKGLGAGSKPEVARKAAEESIEKIKEMFRSDTKMVFITAGMGGGTGTGASPIVAKVAHDLGILTVGIVTIPFAFEGKIKQNLALEGVRQLSENVDAILVINNEKLKDIYPDLELSNAFAKADDVLTNAAKGIAEIITVVGHINTDFADVYTIMKNGKVAIMNTGFAAGENRITKAIENALNSPLLNTNDVSGASKVLLSLYCSTTNQIKMDEIQQIDQFMKKVGEDVTVIWGETFDDTLGDNVKVTLIATGYEVGDIPGMPVNELKEKKQNSDNSSIQNVKSALQRLIPASSDKDDNQKAIDEYYPQNKGATDNAINVDIEELSVDADDDFDMKKIDDEDVVTFTLDELENETTLKKAETEPAWKRRFSKK